MNNIAIVTARSGSKGLKDKNIKELNGIPLLGYSIQAALESNQFNEIMVSTDSELYADISRKYGANVPFLRSEITSGDNSSSWDVVKEVLMNYKRRGVEFDSVCLLQPTSPLRTANNIIEAYLELDEKKADAITSVCEVDHSPIWTMKLPTNLSMQEYREKSRDIPRQMLGMYYRVNGAIYIRKIEYSNDIIILDKSEYAYIMSRESSIDIDTVDDFNYAEFLMKKSNNCI